MNNYKQPRWTGKFISQYITKKGKEFRRDLDAIIPIGRQLTGPVSVSVTLFMPDKRKRDVDNYLKATLDALMPKALEDDSQVVSLWVIKIYRKGDPGTHISIRPCEQAQKQLSFGIGYTPLKTRMEGKVRVIEELDMVHVALLKPVDPQ